MTENSIPNTGDWTTFRSGNPQPNVCPGCGRCLHCGNKELAPVLNPWTHYTFPPHWKVEWNFTTDVQT